MRGWSGDFIYGHLRVSYCHIAADLMYFKIKGRGRPRCKPSSTQGRTTYCVGSLTEWVTRRCSTSVLRLISQPAYFKSSPAEDMLQLLTHKKNTLGTLNIPSIHLRRHFRCRAELHTHTYTVLKVNSILQSQQTFCAIRCWDSKKCGLALRLLIVLLKGIKRCPKIYISIHLMLRIWHLFHTTLKLEEIDCFCYYTFDIDSLEEQFLARNLRLIYNIITNM